jgi:hypothetical protein
MRTGDALYSASADDRHNLDERVRSSAEAVVTAMPRGDEPVRLAGGRGRLPGLLRGAGPGRSSGLLGRSIGAGWTDDHVAGCRPRSVNGRGSAPTDSGLGVEIDTSLRRAIVLGGGLGGESGHIRLGSQVGSHQRPTRGHLELAAPFDSGCLPGIRLQAAISSDGRNLVRIEGSEVQNSLSSTASPSTVQSACLTVRRFSGSLLQRPGGQWRACLRLCYLLRSGSRSA